MKSLLLLLGGFLLSDGALQAHYQLWADSGQAVIDRTAHGHDGYNGDLPSPDGADALFLSRGARFGSGTRLRIPVNSATGLGIPIGQRFSFMAWAFPWGFCPLYRRFASLGSSNLYWHVKDSGPNYYLVLDILPTGTLWGNTVLTLSQWNLFSIRVDCSTNCQLVGHRNFVEILNTSCPGYTDDPTFTSAIGGKFCIIYEVKVFDHLISTVEIGDMLVAPGTGGCPGSCSTPCINDPEVFCPSSCQYMQDFPSSCTGVCPCDSTRCIGNCRMCQGTCGVAGCIGTAYYDCSAHDLCHPSCNTCSGSSSLDCMSCFDAHADLSGGECLCSAGFYLSVPNPFTCSPCHSTCYTCTGPLGTDCSTCKSQAVLDSSTHKCVCVKGTFGSPDASNCLVCDPSCADCSGAGASACTVCQESGTLSAAPPSSCFCKAGYFPESSDCTTCPDSCGSCVNVSTCSSCKENAVLQGKSCHCIDGFYGDAASCLPCSSTCTRCDSSGCLHCLNGFFALGQDCAATCPVGFKPNSTTGKCEEGSTADLRPPVPSLSVAAGNVLRITFQKPMNLALSIDDISIEVTDSQSRVYSATWGIPQKEDLQTISIQLQIDTETLSDGAQAELTFLHPEKVVDQYGIPIEVTSLTGTLIGFGNQKDTSTTLLNGQTATQTAAGATGTVTVGLTASIINGSPSALISLINQLQLISYIAMTRLPLPSEFAQTLAALNAGFMLPNPLKKYTSVDTAADTPEYVQNYGIKSSLFVPNSFAFIGTCVLIMANLVPIYLLSRSKHPLISAYFRRMLPSYRWGVLINLWLTSYLDIGIYALLQLRYLSSASLTVVANAVLAGTALAFFYLTPVFLSIFLWKHRSDIASPTDSHFHSRWKVLFQDFTPNSRYCVVGYWALFTVRRVVLVSTLVLMDDYLKVLGAVNAGMAVCTLLFLLFFRPLHDRFMLMETVLTELSTTIVYLSAASFSWDLSDSAEQTIESIGTWTVRAALIFNVATSLWHSFVLVYTFIKVSLKLMKVESEINATPRTKIFVLPQKVKK